MSRNTPNSNFEIYAFESFLRGEKTPGFDLDGSVTVTSRTWGYMLDRYDQSHPDLPGREKYGSGTTTLARTKTNAEMRGVILMDFRPGYIPVPGTSGIGAWVAHVPPDTVVDSPCPFGLVGWLSGAGI